MNQRISVSKITSALNALSPDDRKALDELATRAAGRVGRVRSAGPVRTNEEFAQRQAAREALIRDIRDAAIEKLGKKVGRNWAYKPHEALDGLTPAVAAAKDYLREHIMDALAQDASQLNQQENADG